MPIEEGGDDKDCIVISVRNESKRETEVYVFYSTKKAGEWLEAARQGLLADSRKELVEAIRGERLPDTDEPTLELKGRPAFFVEQMVTEVLSLVFDEEDDDEGDDGAPSSSEFN